MFSNALVWFSILLSVGIVDALIQFSDYLRWRKDERMSQDAND